MKFDEVKKMLEGKLGHPVKAGAWQELCVIHRPVLVKVLNGELSVDELYRLYSLKMEFRALDERPKEAHPHPPRQAVIEADKRLETLVRIAAIEARRDRLVRWFRDAELGGGSLPPAEVASWIREHEPPRPSTLTPLYAQVPVGDLSDLLKLGLDDEYLFGWDDPENDPAWWGGMEMGLSSRASLHMAWEPEGCASWLEDVARRVRLGEVDIPTSVSPGETLTFRDGASPTGEAHVFVGNSVALSSLKLVAGHLVTWIPWTLEQAVEFVLTDVPQPLIRARMEADLSQVPALGRLHLHIDPRMPAKELASFYEAGRRRFARGRDKQMLEKHLELAVFCAERVGGAAKWRELRDEWNEAHPEWEYTGEGDPRARHFARDGRDAYERVVGRNWEDAKRLLREEEEFELPSLTIPLLEEDAQRRLRRSRPPGMSTIPTDNVAESLDYLKSLLGEAGDEGTS